MISMKFYEKRLEQSTPKWNKQNLRNTDFKNIWSNFLKTVFH